MSYFSRSRWGIVSIGLGTALSVTSLLLVAYDPLWDLLRVATDLRPAYATSLAILFINIGFLVALFFQQGDFESELLKAQAEHMSAWMALIPRSELYSYQTGEEALNKLAELLPTAKTVRNTRIFAHASNPLDHPGFAAWDAAIRLSVKNGLTFREVMSVGNLGLAQDRVAATAGGRGVYEAAILRYSLPSFLNFVIVEGASGTKEVWFGWIISRGSGFEGATIRTAESRIVGLFEQWHVELFGAAKLVE